jgi:WD40 repeat protein
VAFSPDGQTLVTGDERGAQLWEGATRRLLGERTGGSRAVPAAFFPDGKSILLVRKGIAQVWDIATGRVTGPPPFQPDGGIRQVAFNPDGRSVLISGPDRVVRLRDVATGKAVGSPVILDGALPVATCANGRTMAVGGSGGRIVVWNAPEPLAGSVERIRLWVELLAGMEVDSRGVVSVLGPDAVRRHHERLDELGGPPGIPSAGNGPQ